MFRVCLPFLLTAVAFAQNAPLVIQTDLECDVTVDGKPQGILRTGNSLTLNVPLGDHRVEAVSLTGGFRHLQIVEINDSREKKFTIPLQSVIDREETQKRGYWLDPKTKLMWAAQDNASALSWRQADYYCRHLNTGGFQDWTLPSIDTLQAIFGGELNDAGFRILAPLKLTGWAWSSTPGKQNGEGWALDFGDGGRASVAAGDGGLNRALCVRSAEK